MMARKLFTIVPLLVLAVSGALLPPASAQGYPARPVRLIVGFPGGAVDAIARIVAQKLSENLQQQFVVDNRSGASGGIAAEITAKATADGYTLLMISSSHAVNSSLYKKLPYDLVKDFAPLVLIAAGPHVLVAHPSVPIKSVSELIEMARAKPGQLNFASAGTGSLPHLAGELLKSMAHINLTHVPYKGVPAALIDVISGRVELAFGSPSGTLPLIKAGKLKAIAVTATKRSAELPAVPTIAESGVPGYEATNWYGMVAPAATPKSVVDKLNTEILLAMRNSAASDAISREGVVPVGSTSREFEVFLKNEITKWAKVIRDVNIQLD